MEARTGGNEIYSGTVYLNTDNNEHILFLLCLTCIFSNSGKWAYSNVHDWLNAADCFAMYDTNAGMVAHLVNYHICD